jgi:hypothetical protein
MLILVVAAGLRMGSEDLQATVERREVELREAYEQLSAARKELKEVSQSVSVLIDR